jgi:segregation and condensation protein B
LSGDGGDAVGAGEVESGGVVGDEDHLPPGQTSVPVGDEVVVDDETMRRALEAILMVTDEPLPVLTLARAVGRPTGDVAEALSLLAAEYTEQGRGFDLREVGGGWRYYTRAEAAPYVERFVLDGQQARLTQAALETLAVVAYKQPVSRARVSAIRGVNVDGVVRTLVARGLVEEAGADTDSQATLYRTTTYFLERMGMQSLDDLPELAPYLPDMDDVEEELAAQTLPPATTPTDDIPSTETPDDIESANTADEAGYAADDASTADDAEVVDDVEEEDAASAGSAEVDGSADGADDTESEGSSVAEELSSGSVEIAEDGQGWVGVEEARLGGVRDGG